jgi:hypothetical protein
MLLKLFPKIQSSITLVPKSEKNLSKNDAISLMSIDTKSSKNTWNLNPQQDIKKIIYHDQGDSRDTRMVQQTQIIKCNTTNNRMKEKPHHHLNR